MYEFTPSDYVWGILERSEVVLGVALLLFIAVLIASAVRARGGGRGWASATGVAARAPWDVRCVALATLLVWMLRAFQHYLFLVLPPQDSVMWFQMPPGYFFFQILAPLAVAFVGLLILLVRRRSSDLNGQPDLTSRWNRFLGRWHVVAGATLFVVLLGTAIWAGTVSVKDMDGWYVSAISVQNDMATATGPMFGWTYGIPTVALAAATLVVAILLVRQRARRSLMAEGRENVAFRVRQVEAAAIAQVAMAGIALALGEAFRLIGAAGQGGMGTNDPETGEMVFWESRFAPLTDPMNALWFLITVGALVFLLLAVAGRPLGSRGAAGANEPPVDA